MNQYIIAVLMICMSITATAKNKHTKIDTFKVYGVCNECKERIETALKEKGVYKASWDIESNMLRVRFDSTKYSRSSLQQLLAAIGHDTEDFIAADSTYENLPDCCHYERTAKAGPVAEKSTTDTLVKPSIPVVATQSISGLVYEINKKGDLLPLESAVIRVLSQGKSGITDSNGHFLLLATLPAQISVAYIGLKTDTFQITSTEAVNIVLRQTAAQQLRAVVVHGRQASSFIAPISTLNTRSIGTKELAKAACCNLSESFETTPSVDVSYADAVTGIKQIQLLGLSGNYTQITTENTPEIRGLSSIYGFTFIPGTWIESIQVTKGTGSVANGFEGMAGQINIEEHKPHNSDKVFVNAYANAMGRLETSVNLSKKINEKWSTALLSHANGVAMKSDRNHDGFIDMPIGRQFNVINRWRFTNNKGLFSQFIVKALNDKRQSGQMDFEPATDKLGQQRYGVGTDIQQYAFTGKLGYVFPDKAYKSIGFIVSANTYNNNAYYGLRQYDGSQTSMYANLIYQSIIGTTAHQFRAGLSFANDYVKETVGLNQYKRTEIVPGAFGEYTFTPNPQWTAIGGLRLDYHNQYGLMLTPRLHVKYDINANTNLRFSAGSGFRTANIFAENVGLFASSRQFQILAPSSTYAYGLNPERSWNFGVNLVHSFSVLDRKATLSVDAYRTFFTNQVVVDVDASPQGVSFYNLDGKSFSNSIQAELDYELLPHFDLRLAYRWLDVKTTYSGVLRQKPLQAKHRAFMNLAYETHSHWKFDATTQWISAKRLPITISNPEAFQLQAFSPAYWQLGAQVTKQFGPQWDVYLGVENLTNYKQKNPILGVEQPFSPYFDGSMVWGPINGRILYVGMRFKIE